MAGDAVVVLHRSEEVFAAEAICIIGFLMGQLFCRGHRSPRIRATSSVGGIGGVGGVSIGCTAAVKVCFIIHKKTNLIRNIGQKDDLRKKNFLYKFCKKTGKIEIHLSQRP